MLLRRHEVGVRAGRIIIVTLLWSEIMGGYNTPDTTLLLVMVL